MAASRNRSVVVVTAGAILQMVVQFVLQIILAKEFGAGSEMDAYGAAAVIPLVIAGMVGVPLGSVLIPSLSRSLASDGEPAAMRLAGQCGLVFATGTLLFGALVAWSAVPITSLFYGDMPGSEQQVTAHLLRLLAWLIPANTLTMFCQSFQNWRGQFLLPALAGVFGPAVTVVIVVLLAPDRGIEAVAIGMVAGAVLNVLMQWPGMRDVRWVRPSAEQLRGPIAMMGPLLLGGVCIRIEPLVDRSLAADLGVGVIGYLTYTSRIVNAMLALSSGALSVVAFPYLAKAAAKGRAELASEVSRTLVMLTFLVLPFLAAFFVFAPEIVRDLLQRGEFDSADTVAVATLIRWSLGLVLGASVGEITARAFYADHCMWPPVLVGMVTLTLAIVAKLALVSTYGAVALVGTSSAAYCAAMTILLVWLLRRLGPQMFAGVPQAVLTSLACAACACLAGGLISSLPLPLPAVWGGLTGAVTYAIAAVLLPGQFSTRILEIVRARFSRD